MAVIIYGTREYGLVDEHQGELASTTFFHLWFAPILPVGSTWITHASAGERQGHRIKLYGKSVAAAYLRVWGPIVAIGNMAASFERGSVVHLAIAFAAIALCAWSWTWRKLRGDRAKRRSDFNYVAFGTRVEPGRLDVSTRAELKTALDQQWNARAPKGSPNDVARHGTTDPAEAVLAYGLLRLAAIERRGKGEEAADADRILDGDHVPTAAGEGPYRGGAVPVAASTAASATLGDLVAARAAAFAEEHARIAPNKADVRDALRRRRRRYRLGLAAAVVCGIGGATMVTKAIKPTLDVTLAQLRSVHPPTHRYVNVTCDSVLGPLWEETSSRGDVEKRIVMCELGNYHLAVKYDDDDTIPTRVVSGELRDIPDSAVWVKDGLRQEPDIEAATLDVYVDADHGRDRGLNIIIGVTFLLGAPLLFWLYVRWTRRNRELLA